MKNFIISDKIFDAREQSFQVDKDCVNPYYFTIKAGKFEIPYSYDYHSCGYATKEEAELAKEKLIKSNAIYNRFASVSVNVIDDPVAGKSHRVINSLFAELSDAYDYVLSKEDKSFKPNEDGSPKIEFGMDISKKLYYTINSGIYTIELHPYVSEKIKEKTDIIQTYVGE